MPKMANTESRVNPHYHSLSNAEHRTFVKAYLQAHMAFPEPEIT